MNSSIAGIPLCCPIDWKTVLAKSWAASTCYVGSVRPYVVQLLSINIEFRDILFVKKRKKDAIISSMQRSEVSAVLLEPVDSVV